MQTRHVKVDPRSFRPEELSEAAALLKGGGLVVFPTETVYGLGANALDPDAVHRLRQLKERPPEKPFTLHLADVGELDQHVEKVPHIARLLMARYWPGPLTIIFPGHTGQGVGIRVPASELARELIRQVGAPLVAPSANPRAKEPAVDGETARAYFDGVIDAVVDGGPTVIGQSSTVVEINQNGYQVLREGMITHEMIHQLLVGKNILFICTGNSCRSPMAEALFKKLLAERLGRDVEDLKELGYTVHSAGTLAYGGGRASQNAVQVMEEMGCEISNHVARPLNAAMVQEADRIYAMSGSHVRQVIGWDHRAGDKIQVIHAEGIPDPIGGDVDAYRKCAATIKNGLRVILEGTDPRQGTDPSRH